MPVGAVEEGLAVLGLPLLVVGTGVVNESLILGVIGGDGQSSFDFLAVVGSHGQLLLADGVGHVIGAFAQLGVAADGSSLFQHENACALLSGSGGSGHAGAACAHDGNIHVIAGVLALGSGDFAVVAVGVNTGSGQGGTDGLQQAVAGQGGGGHSVHSDGVVLHHLRDHLVESDVAHTLSLLLLLDLDVGDDTGVVQGDSDDDVAVAALAGTLIGAGHGAGSCRAAGALAAAGQQGHEHRNAEQHCNKLLAHDSFLLVFLVLLSSCPQCGDAVIILTCCCAGKQEEFPDTLIASGYESMTDYVIIEKNPRKGPFVMTLNQLRYFRVLARTEHYTKAADALGISQPSLSRAIALLEEETGVLLFTRRGRNVVLTEAGRTLMRFVEPGLDTLDAGMEAMRAFRGGEERVAIGSITPVVNTYLPKMLAEFRTEVGSEAGIDIRVDQTERLLAGLKAGFYDMVFCSYQPGEMGVVFTPVVELPFVVAMRRDDPLAQYKELTPDQLRGRPMVFTDSPAYSDLLNRMLGDYGIRPEIKGFSNEDSVLLSMV